MNFILEPTPLQVNLPNIVYKYRKWADKNHQNTLKKNQFYLASFSEFNSRFEHNLETDYGNEEQIKQQIYDFAYNDAINQHKSHDEAIKFAKFWVINSPGLNSEHRKKVEALHRHKLSNKRGILSLTKRWDNQELWNSFASMDRGFVIGLDPNFLFIDGKPQGMWSPITYYPLDNPPKISSFKSKNPDSIEEYLNIINYLPDIYEHEEEYRYSMVLRNGNRKLHIHKRFFKEIIIGKDMDLTHKSEISHLVKRRFPETKIYEQKTDENTGIMYRNLLVI